MDFTKNISTADLKSKRQELEALIKDAQAKIVHLDYVLKNFANEQMPTLFHENEPLNTKDAIIKILREAGKKMEGKDVFRAIVALGVKCTKNTFNLRIGELTKNPSQPIKRVSRGVYKYAP